MRALLASASIITMMSAGAAYAQQAENATSEGSLEEIIVTAQRTSEPLQKAALAVDVLKGADLLEAGITQIDRLGQLSPALSVGGGGTGAIVFVRGVGNFTVTPNSDPAVAFSYDGVYLGRPSSTTGMFYDLERIEVLKGPQGTLYGRNATGGAINVIPVQPKLGVLSGYATATYGNYDAITAEGAVNIPMGDKGALRLSGSIARHDGYLKDDTDDDKTGSVRVQMKAQLTPDLDVRMAFDYSHTGGKGAGFNYIGSYAYNPFTQAYAFIPSGLDHEGYYTSAAQAFRSTVAAGTAGRNFDALTDTPFVDNDFYGANAEINYRTDAGTLTILPAWRDSSIDLLTGAAAFSYRQREKDAQISVEARFDGERIGIFDYMLGAYYFDEDIRQRPYLSISSAFIITDQRYTTKSYAAFGRLTANITDQLRLVGGARYTKDKKHFEGSTISGALICVAGLPPSCPTAVLFPLVSDVSQLPFAFPATPGIIPQIVGGIPTGALVARAVDRDDDRSLNNNKLTWRAAVEFDVAPRSLLYASFETGYRSGGFSAATGFETFDPEYIDAYTIGMKNRFLDNKLQLNVEAFYWKYKDQQVNHVGLDQGIPPRPSNFTQNIGRSRMQGIEVEAQALVTSTTLIRGQVQYLDTKDIDFIYDQAGPVAPLTGCAIITPPGGVVPPPGNTAYQVDCSGFPAYNSPKWTINLAAQQTMKLDGYEIVFSADTQYKSRYYDGFAYLAEQRVGSSWRSNAQVALAPSSGSWSIAAYVRNIEDNREPVSSSLHPGANLLTGSVSAPRTYGLRVSADF